MHVAAGNVVLQEELPLDSAPDGLALLPRLPYLAGERLGDSVVDMLLVGDQVGGYRPSCLPPEAQAALAEVSARFLARVSPKGAGVLSFGVSGGKLVLLGAQMGGYCVCILHSPPPPSELPPVYTPGSSSCGLIA